MFFFIRLILCITVKEKKQNSKNLTKENISQNSLSNDVLMNNNKEKINSNSLIMNEGSDAGEEGKTKFMLKNTNSKLIKYLMTDPYKSESLTQDSNLLVSIKNVINELKNEIVDDERASDNHNKITFNRNNEII